MVAGGQSAALAPAPSPPRKARNGKKIDPRVRDTTTAAATPWEQEKIRARQIVPSVRLARTDDVEGLWQIQKAPGRSFVANAWRMRMRLSAESGTIVVRPSGLPKRWGTGRQAPRRTTNLAASRKCKVLSH